MVGLVLHPHEPGRLHLLRTLLRDGAGDVRLRLIAALGDKDATWRGTVILATVVTVFGVGLFSYFLQVPMPIFTWRGGL